MPSSPGKALLFFQLSYHRSSALYCATTTISASTPLTSGLFPSPLLPYRLPFRTSPSSSHSSRRQPLLPYLSDFELPSRPLFFPIGSISAHNLRGRSSARRRPSLPTCPARSVAPRSAKSARRPLQRSAAPRQPSQPTLYCRQSPRRIASSTRYVELLSYFRHPYLSATSLSASSVQSDRRPSSAQSLAAFYFLRLLDFCLPSRPAPSLSATSVLSESRPFRRPSVLRQPSLPAPLGQPDSFPARTVCFGTRSTLRCPAMMQPELPRMWYSALCREPLKTPFLRLNDGISPETTLRECRENGGDHRLDQVQYVPRGCNLSSYISLLT